jgi:YhcH/YjgK/YiaL family protein
MKNSCTYISLTLVLIICLTISASSQEKWTVSSARKWVESKEWAKGSNLKLNPVTDYVEFAKQYHANEDYWNKAFAFLNDHKLDTLRAGRYVIDGDHVFAIITDAQTKDTSQVAWESHRKYIDLHYVIRGKEKIGMASVKTAKVVKAYDDSRDAANYNVEGQYYVAMPGEFFLFFPGDAHRPGIKADGTDSDKKLVIKISYVNEGQ